MTRSNPLFFILDVDGVMTDGSFLYSEFGKVYKKFGPHDHDGIKLIKHLIKIIFVTADSSGFPISKKRIVDDMKQELILLKEDNRKLFLEQHYQLNESIYMGDGLYDAPILRKAFFGIAPCNARIEAKKACNYVTPSSGGQGAVLDACLKILDFFFLKSIKK